MAVLKDRPNTWWSSYLVWVNTKVGAIVVSWANSPKDPVTNPRGPPVPPPLRRLSDFTFLAYQDACHNDPQCNLANLEWVIHHQVADDITNLVIQKATGRSTNFPKWPGKSFTTRWGNGKALVGCPNGFGVLYLVGQHTQTALGYKTVDKAYIFADQMTQPTWGQNIAFHLKTFTPKTKRGSDVVAVDGEGPSNGSMVFNGL